MCTHTCLLQIAAWTVCTHNAQTHLETHTCAYSKLPYSSLSIHSSSSLSRFSSLTRSHTHIHTQPLASFKLQWAGAMADQIAAIRKSECWGTKAVGHFRYIHKLCHTPSVTRTVSVYWEKGDRRSNDGKYSIYLMSVEIQPLRILKYCISLTKLRWWLCFFFLKKTKTLLANHCSSVEVFSHFQLSLNFKAQYGSASVLSETSFSSSSSKQPFSTNTLR